MSDVLGAQTPLEDRAPPAEPGAVLGSETEQAIRGLFGRDSLYVLLWALQLGFAALVTPIATRLLSSTSFGRVTAAAAVMQVLVSIGGMSLQSAVQREYAREDGPRRARRLVTLAIVLSASMLVVADLSGPEWSSLLRLRPFHGTVQYAVAWASMVAISNAALGWLRSRDRLAVFAAVSLLQSIGAAVVGLALVAFVSPTASEFVLGQLIAQVLAVLVALVATRPLTIRRRDLPMVRGALRYSSGLVPAALGAFGLTAAARLVIQHDLTSTAVARYSIAFNVGVLPVTLLYVLDISWMPRFFALSGELLRSAVLSASRDAIYALLIPTIVGINAGAPIVLALWAPAGYHLSSLLPVVALLSACALPMAGVMAAMRVLLIDGRTGAAGAYTVLAALFTVALTVALVPLLNIEGAALASLSGYLLLHWLLTRAAQGIVTLSHPPIKLQLSCLGSVAIAALCTQVPAGAPFMVARALLTLVCLSIFTALFCDLVMPDRFPRMTQLARRIHVRAIEP